jgi:hypothetical protein
MDKGFLLLHQLDTAGGAERGGEGGQSGYDELKHGLPDVGILDFHNSKEFKGWF